MNEATIWESIAAPPPPVDLRDLRLPAAARAAWTRRALELRFPDYRDLDQWHAFRAASVWLAREFLPWQLDLALRNFFQPGGDPFVVIEDLPVDPQLPPIPADGFRPAGKQAVSEAVIMGLIGRYAEVLSFINEKHGCPIHEITPVEGMETVQSNAGRVRFGYHSDNAFLPRQHRQRGILLFGLINPRTATTVITAEDILKAASPGLARLLAQPLYRHACPASYAVGSPPLLSAPGPILWRDIDGVARVSAASSSILAATPEAENALSEFRALVDSMEPARVLVAPGAALLFHDDRVLHGRDAVQGPRWLQRAYFTDSLAPQRAATGADPRAFSFDARVLLQEN